MILGRRENRRSIIACIASMTSMSVTLGLCWPFLALVLERQGVPLWLNGLSAAVQGVAVLAVMPIAPLLIGRFGTARAMMVGTSLLGVGLVLLPVYDNVWAWFPIRFALGLGAELVFITGDIWINQLAEERTRGRLIGIYSTILLAGFAVGPLAIVALGTEDWTVLYLALAVVLLGLGFLAMARGGVPVSNEKPRARLVHFLRIARPLMIAGLMFGLVGSSVESLLPVYGLEKGLEEGMASLMLTVFVIGSLLAQFPVGLLADHVDARKLLIWGASITLMSLVVMPYSSGHVVSMWIVMLVLGASMGSFYIVALTMMGRRFQGTALIGINTSFGFMWGLGATVGPGLSGASMSLVGPDGLPGMGVLLCSLFLVVCLRSPKEPVQRERFAVG